MPFDPTQLSNLQLLVDARSGVYQDIGLTTPTTTSGQTIEGWKDLSGKNNHLIAYPVASYGPGGLAVEGTGTFVYGAGGANAYLACPVTSSVPSAMSLHILGKMVNLGTDACISFGSGSAPAYFTPCWATDNFILPQGTTNNYVTADMNFHYYSVVYTSGGIYKLYEDGAFLSSGVASAPSITAFVLGGSNPMGIGSDMRFAHVAIGYGDDSANVNNMLQWYWANFPGIYPQPSSYLIWEGDSLSTGYYTNNSEMCAYVWATKPSPIGGVRGTNVSYGGRTIANAIAEFPSGGGFLAQQASSPVAVLWLGTNSVSSSTGSGVACYNQYVSLAQKYLGVGAKVVATTIMPRAASSGFEAQRLIFNNLIRTNWPQFAHALADLGADPIVSYGPNATNNGTYYADAPGGTHLSANGNNVGSKYFIAAINQAFQSSGHPVGVSQGGSVNTNPFRNMIY